MYTYYVTTSTFHVYYIKIMDNGTLITFHNFLFFFFYHLKRSREFWVIVMSFKKHALFNIYSLACTYLNFINLNMSVYTFVY